MSNAMKWFLTISAVVTLGVALALGFSGDQICLGAGMIGFGSLLVAANLDRISEFKASKSGFEAKTRDLVAKAEVALSELQLLATNVAQLSLSFVMRQGRWGGYSDEEKEKIRSSVLGVLNKLDLSQEVINSVLKEWHQVEEFDYAHCILGGSRIPEGVSPSVMVEWRQLREGGLFNCPTPIRLREFLNKHQLMTGMLEELLADYEFYLVHHKHRRPQVWSERDKWGHLVAPRL